VDDSTSGETGENWKKRVKTTGSSAYTRTRNLPHASKKRYSCNQFVQFVNRRNKRSEEPCY